MKTICSKITSTAAAAVAILFACVLAGLGLTALVYLALFALAVIGLGFIAAPFVAIARKSTANAMGPMSNENVSAG